MASLPAYAEKVLLIGDSLSDDGGFGAGLAQALSEGGTACSFAASNSRFESWTESDFSCCKVGSHARVYANGKAVKPAVANARPPSSWGISAFLDPQSGLCAPKGEPVDRMLVQLGTNPSKNTETYLKKIIQMACTRGVKNLNFVLPPEDRKKAQTKTNLKMADIIDAYHPCPESMTLSYFPSATKAPIAAKDFRSDGTHFWSSPSEKNWLGAVVAWARSGYPKIAVHGSTPVSEGAAAPAKSHSK